MKYTLNKEVSSINVNIGYGIVAVSSYEGSSIYRIDANVTTLVSGITGAFTVTKSTNFQATVTRGTEVGTVYILVLKSL